MRSYRLMSEGQGEFRTDGTWVNIRQGWREMRLAVCVKRPAGEPALPQRWRDRKLGATTIRAAFCWDDIWNSRAA